MYRYFEEDYSKIDLDGSEICKDWIEAWIFTTPDDHQLLEDMTETFCPCLETVRGHCDGCDHALNCIPITFHQLTLLEAFDMLCNDDKMKKRDCINYIGYIGIELGTLNFTAASMCYSAMDLGNKLTELTSNLKALMCECLGPAITLLSYDTYQSDNFELALSCINEEFAMDLTECPSDLYDGDSFQVPITTDYELEAAIIYADVKVDESSTTGTIRESAASPTRNAQFSTDYWDSSSTWKSITIAEVVAVVFLSGSAFFMNRRRIKMDLN